MMQAITSPISSADQASPTAGQANSFAGKTSASAGQADLSVQASTQAGGLAIRQTSASDRERSHYSIGELCDEFAVTARALRFYEDEALIAPERRGTTRLYSERDRARLAWILRGKRVGLSLADIKELLDLYDIGDGRKTQRLMTIERCQAQADKLEQQRVDIDATLNELNQFIALVKAQVEES